MNYTDFQLGTINAEFLSQTQDLQDNATCKGSVTNLNDSQSPQNVPIFRSAYTFSYFSIRVCA